MRLGRKGLSVSILSLTVLALVVLLQYGPAPRRDASPSDPSIRSVVARVGGIVDSLFAQYGIRASKVRTWEVHAGGTPVRIEQRIPVPPAFVSVSFNRDLNDRLVSLGAHVVAVEHAKENTVMMHIVKDGLTIRTLDFVTEPEN